MNEVTYEDWQENPTPREMWVWDDEEEKVQAKVISVVKADMCIYPVLSIMKDDVGYDTFQHCAEIEEPKTRRMTNKELSKGKPQWHKVADGDLPGNDRYVWTNVGACYYDEAGWWDDFGRLQDVIAWCEPKFEE